VSEFWPALIGTLLGGLIIILTQVGLVFLVYRYEEGKWPFLDE
jgi:hypothetical protein